jgi:hypothetical protein
MTTTTSANGNIGSTPGFMTGPELAAIFRTSPETVRYWRHIGYGPKGKKVGRHVLYEVTEVNSWITSLDVPSSK